MNAEQEDDQDLAEPIKEARQIFDRRRFAGPLRAEAHEVEKIVKPYDLPRAEWVRCGLNGCTTEHGKGYIIRLKDGRETNCGHMCGNREFDADFDEFVTAFEARKTSAARRAVLRKAKESAAPMLEKAQEMVSQLEVATIRVGSVMEVVGRCLEIRYELDRVLRLGGQVQIEEAISQETRDATGTKERFTRKTIAIVQGGEAGRDHGKALASIRNLVIPSLIELRDMRLDAITPESEPILSKKISETRDLIQYAESFLKAAGSFCTPSNILAIAKIGETMKRKQDRTQRALRALERLAESSLP